MIKKVQAFKTQYNDGKDFYTQDNSPQKTSFESFVRGLTGSQNAGSGENSFATMLNAKTDSVWLTKLQQGVKKVNPFGTVPDIKGQTFVTFTFRLCVCVCVSSIYSQTAYLYVCVLTRAFCVLDTSGYQSMRLVLPQRINMVLTSFSRLKRRQQKGL